MSKVPPIPPELLPGVNPYRAGLRVRGSRQWRPAADAANYLLGTGGVLINSGPTSIDIAAGSSQPMKFYPCQHEQNPARLWVLTLLLNGTGPAHGTFEAPDGATIGKWSIQADNVTKSFEFIETVGSPTSTPGSITVRVRNSANSAGPVWVAALACYELPARNLASFSAAQVPEASSCNTKQAIYREADDERSINAVAKAAVAAETEARRSSLFSTYFPTPVNIVAVANPASSNIFAFDIPIQPRALYSGEVARDISWAVFFKVNGGGNAHVQAESNTGDIDDHTVTSATEAAVTGAVSCQTEDPSRRLIDGGLRAGVRGWIRFTAWRGTCTSIDVYGAHVAEYPK